VSDYADMMYFLWLDAASVDRYPKGEDPQGLRAQHESAVGAAETPENTATSNTSPTQGMD